MDSSNKYFIPTLGENLLTYSNGYSINVKISIKATNSTITLVELNNNSNKHLAIRFAVFYTFNN